MNERGTGHGAIGRAACSRGRVCALTTWVLLLAATVAMAQPADVDADAASASGPAPADLVVANRTIVTLRAPVSGASPAQRAAAISEHIDDLLARGGTPIVSRTAVDGGYMIQVNDEPAFRILDADVDPDLQQTTAQVAEQATARLEQALAEIAEARNARAMLPALGWTLLATAVLALCLWAVVRVYRWSAHRVRAAFERRKLRYGAGWQGQLLGAADPATLAVAPLRFLGWLVALFLLYTWTGFVLQRFPYTRPWGETLRDNLLAALGDFGASVVRAIPGLLFVVLIFLIARVAVRIVRALFDAAYAGRVDLGWIDQSTARPTGQLLSAVIWLFALVAAYPYIPGSDSEAFRGVGVFVGLMLSIGSSGIVNQAVSGMMLMYTRSLRPGEFVQIGETEGTVTSIGFMTTRLETVRREEISIPNAVIAANVMRNYSRLAPVGGVRVATKVNIGYDIPWRQVHAMLLLAAGRTGGLVAGTEPRVLQTALLDFYVEYTLLVAVADPSRRAPVLSELNANIQDVFNENGVQIMTPNYEADPAAPKVVASADWFRTPARRPEPGTAPVRGDGGTPG